MAIGLISAMRHVAGTSPKSRIKKAASTQWGNISNIVFEISSRPEADLCGNFATAENSSPYKKVSMDVVLIVVVHQHEEERARRASKVMVLSAALSFGSLLTDAYSLQSRLAFVKLVEASLPSSDEITDEDCADGVIKRKLNEN